jgi:excinuclease ABC subunit B
VRAVAEQKATYSVGQAIPRDEALRMIRELEAEMKTAARQLEFEKAAMLRDQIADLRKGLD